MNVQILVFDEDPLILQAFENFMEKENYQMLAARSLHEATALMQKQTPHLIILNLSLKDTDWQDFLAFRNRHHPHIPILGITAYPEIMYEKKNQLSGIEEICLKPLDIAELREKIHELLPRHHSMH